MTVEFVSYDGTPDYLCEGTLTVRIDGQEITFGDKEGCDYPRFWLSRGDCGGDKGSNVRWEPHRAGWTLKRNKLPAEFKGISKEMIRLMEENIRPWCGGGCRNR